jgi:hydrogenase/urease accessory protein HupE
VFTTNSLARIFILSASLLLLGLFSQLAFAHGMSEAEKLSIIEGGNIRYLSLGVTHMLSGYDHLAFVFGIIFFLKTFRDIAKYVTAFTVGHSITLIFATFNGIQLNYFLIDAVIALSVCYIAFSNIDGFRKYLNINPPNMMLMIVGFGLIHGFGLSTRLQELPLSDDQLLLNILSFNLGIELGQISALALMLIIISAWRKSHFFTVFSRLTNFVLILFGGLLFLMQMHGYEHSINAEELSAATQTTIKPMIKQEVPQQSNWTDTITITIDAYDYIEYKLFAAKEATFNYQWQSDNTELLFDFHGEPENDTSGYFKSYLKNTASQDSGSLTTTFAGTHGWYWENDSADPITITLNISGDYQRLDREQ